MDLSFFRRAEMRFAGRSAVRLDYGVLIATLDALQSASTAARTLRNAGSEGSAPAARNPAIELILGGPGWREAIDAQGGAFNRVCAKHAGKGA